MPYIRLTIAKPRRGEEARVEELFRKLNTLCEGQEGHIQSFLLRPNDDSGEFARIAIYEDEAAAESVANNQSLMALRSEIHLSVDSAHTERAFFTI